MKFINHKNVLSLAFSSILLVTVSSYAEESISNQKTISDQKSYSSTFFTKEKWGVSYLNYMNGPTFSESTGSSINHYLTLKHKFNSDWALSAVLRPDTNIETGNVSTTMADPYMKLDYPTIYKGSNGLKITGDVRYFAPLSESSKKSKTQGTVSTYINTSLSVRNFDYLYVFIPKLYLNTQDNDGQKVASHGHYISANYKITQKVSLDFALYPVWTLSRNTPVSFNNLPAYPGFSVNFTNALSLSPYMEIPLLKAEYKTMSVGGLLSYVIL